MVCFLKLRLFPYFLYRDAALGDLEINFDVLRGCAIASKDRLTLLNESEISLEPAERFRRLFKVKEKWTLEELLPYLEYAIFRAALRYQTCVRPLEGVGVSIDNLLLKYARSSTFRDASGRIVKNKKLFSSKQKNKRKKK